MPKSSNNYAFIDSQNLNLGVRSAGWQVDYRRFRLYLKNKYGVNKALIFIGFVENNQKLYTQQKARIFAIGYVAEYLDGKIQLGKHHDQMEWVDIRDFRPEKYHFEGGWLKGVMEYIEGVL